MALITQQEYEARLSAWAQEARAAMAGKVQGRTHGSGTLAKRLKVQVKESRKTSSHWIGFNFRRYGVFVSYGVGRGWIRQGESVVRGQRVKKGSNLESQLRKRGYSKKEISKYAVSSASSGKGRKPVDWFDSVLRSKIGELADIAADYYGDDCMGRLLEMMNRMTIEKRK